jgi:nitrate/nitrite-specific signal transduction histidine kinase
MTSKATGSYFGKYKEIILAVAFFLVFDMAVLVLNFYISFQISEDALAINLAGRQRMLSQRMTATHWLN